MSKKILVVEDEASLLKALKDKLYSKGFEVLGAKDGVQGKELALKEKPDLILLDIKMPRMDGIEMVHQIRGDSWGHNAKVIILSNLDDNSRIKDALDVGIYEYLIKSDWKIEDLAQKIEETLK